MNKKFDAVEMKRQIQEKLTKEMEGLSPEQQARFMEETILKNPHTKRVWKQSRKQKSA
jgi:hypothetical protein